MAAIRYKGPKPCAGCGRPSADAFRKRQDDICDDCEKAIKWGKVALQKAAEEKLNDPIVEFTFCDAIHHEPRWLYGVRYDHLPYIDSEAGRTLREYFMNYLRSIDLGEQPYVDCIRMGGDMAYRLVVHIRKSQLIRFFELVDALSKYINFAEKVGYRKGNNLLMGLADGSMSVQQFEKSIKATAN